MRKSWIHKVGLQHMHLTRYVKAVLGVGARPNVKLETLVCEALTLKGKPKPEGAGAKWWIGQNGVHIKTVSSARLPTGVKPQDISPQASDAFLSSFEWRRIRMVALKKYGARCQCCGASPADGAVMNVDHIKPRKLFPELALDVKNLQILCHDCNHGKGNWDMTDWRQSEQQT